MKELETAFETAPAKIKAASAEAIQKTRLLQLSEPVDINLEQKGKPVRFDQYGMITDQLRAGVVKLTVTMPLDYPAIGFQIQESSKTVRLLENKGDETVGSIFQKDITIHQTEDGSTLYPDLEEANIRWVEICNRVVNETGEVGVVVKMFVVALVSQGGTFYLTYQEMFSEEAIVWKGTVKIPGLGRSKAWRDLGHFLEQQLGDMLEAGTLMFRELEDITFTKPKEYDRHLAATLPDNTGVVQWYSLRMQNGAVVTNRGAVRAHWSHVMVERQDGLKYLVEGERVNFKALKPSHKGAGHKSQFSWEAQGISLK